MKHSPLLIVLALCAVAYGLRRAFIALGVHEEVSVYLGLILAFGTYALVRWVVETRQKRSRGTVSEP